MGKCPFCHESDLVPVKPEVGDGYVILEANTRTRKIQGDRALPVSLYGCLNCKSIVMQCPTLIPK